MWCRIFTKKHLETHFKLKHDRESLQTHICPHCGKLFDLGPSLKSHIRNIHEKGEYPCPVCNAIFPRKASLRKHSEMHELGGHPKRQCPMCPKLVASLSRHIRIVHEKSRPYVCTICNFAFGQKVNLNLHMTGFHKIAKS